MRSVLLALVPLLVCAALIGCGPGGPTTYPVSGAVSLDGTPVPEGDIIFIDPAGTAAAGQGTIKDGKYTANITPGKKRVEIRASKMMPLPAGQVGAMGEKEMKQDYIPKKYNDQSELSMEVKAGSNSQNFDLVSK